MPSAPYIMVTPRLGNSTNGCYFVKFGGTSKGSARLKEYDNYNPEQSRSQNQLDDSTDYKILGSAIQSQIFQASHKERLGRGNFVPASGNEWFAVWPKDGAGKSDWTKLQAVVDQWNVNKGLAQQDGQVATDPSQPKLNPFINWLAGIFVNSWINK
ncbi:hypothetical protein BKA70DRAFT_1218734 [Coprinopsis sp. MPI-PUGE-AT-0042]|nr:hypothetical protein BKA70DRAFT_1218734 [Coprinopsis sp. MPI-PUGE-AT-0042]